MKELLKLKKKIEESQEKYKIKLERSEDILDEVRVDALQDVLYLINARVKTIIFNKLTDLKKLNWRFGYPDMMIEDIICAYDETSLHDVFESHKQLKEDLLEFINEMEGIFKEGKTDEKN